MSRKSATRNRPTIAAVFAWFERVLTERGRDRGLVERDELDRQRTGLEHEREILRLLDVADPRDLGVARDAAGERAVGVVDLRPRANLAVEHDREVLRRVAELAAHVLGARDLLEAVAALVRELERHDRLVGRRVEVLARAGELQVGTRHLRHVRRVVLEEVVRVRRWVTSPTTRAHDWPARRTRSPRCRSGCRRACSRRAACRRTSRAPSPSTRPGRRRASSSCRRPTTGRTCP